MKSKILIVLFAMLVCIDVFANPLPYDVIYVRYPAVDPTDEFVTIPQGEHAYDIQAGADLMLLKEDDTEVVLVDCTACSVMDPYISYDGNTVYYSLIVDIPTDSIGQQAAASWIYKIHLDDPNYTPIRLTFDDGFDSLLYAGNSTQDDNQSDWRNVRDMSPVPLADGRLLFTSNRAGLTALDPGTNATVNGSVQQMYVMDDHEGELNTKELSNIKKLEEGSLHLVQHPMQLKDGRILFSTWQDVGNKFHYAMTSLFTVYPDGTNLQQFTEPHDHAKNLDHFITQLPNEDVVSGYYYPSFDYGYGILHKFPISVDGPDFLRGSIKGSFREFDRKGTVNMTPHTIAGDLPAPDRSGKYSMPSIGGKGSLLVAYSTGYVNWFDAVCGAGRTGDDYKCEALKSGIYMIPNAMTNIIYNPSELVMVKDDPNYNEIWPRAVLSYQELYGVERPNIIADDLKNTNNATALMGTSSMYNRESNSDGGDPFQYSDRREIHEGNWLIQGADAGVYENSDIHAVRILGTPAQPFNKPIDRYGGQFDEWTAIRNFLPDNRDDRPVAKYGSFHGEKWEILGEFPLTHKGTIDAQGNPDTSWIAKVPADTPLLIQTLDANGMTLNSELTWRALKAGEKRVDCGGCHIHSGDPLDIATTQAGQGAPILNVAGVLNSDGRIKDGIWDLTTGSIPVLNETGTTFINQRVLGVEFIRDVMPVLQTSCASCHNDAGSTPNLTGDSLDVYSTLTDGSGLHLPQVSRYIRSPQARQSLLAWVVYGGRLDGRTNAERDNDVDYPTTHPVLNLSDSEKRIISRWIDLGGAVDFPNAGAFAYTQDSQLPVIARMFADKPAKYTDHFSVGIMDARTDIDWSTLEVTYYSVTNPSTIQTIAINQADKVDEFDVLHINLDDVGLAANTEYVLKVSIQDVAGNKNEFTQKLTKGTP